MISVQISQKYLNFEHQYGVISMYFFRKLQSLHNIVILVQTSQKYLIGHYIIHLRNFLLKIKRVGAHFTPPPPHTHTHPPETVPFYPPLPPFPQKPIFRSNCALFLDVFHGFKLKKYEYTL